MTKILSTERAYSVKYAVKKVREASAPSPYKYIKYPKETETTTQNIDWYNADLVEIL